MPARREKGIEELMQDKGDGEFMFRVRSQNEGKKEKHQALLERDKPKGAPSQQGRKAAH